MLKRKNKDWSVDGEIPRQEPERVPIQWWFVRLIVGTEMLCVLFGLGIAVLDSDPSHCDSGLSQRCIEGYTAAPAGVGFLHGFVIATIFSVCLICLFWSSVKELFDDE